MQNGQDVRSFTVAAKPSQGALSKTTREKAREYLKDRYLAKPQWKYEMIEAFLNEQKRIQ